MKKPVVLVALGMLLAFVIMAGVVGFSSMVLADRGVVLVNESDIDVSLNALESTPAGRTPSPTPAETDGVRRAQPRASVTPPTPQPSSADGASALAPPTRVAAPAPDQPRGDDGAEPEDARQVIDRRDESYRAQLLRAYDLVATARPRVTRPVRRRAATPTPASIIGPAPTQDAHATPAAIATAQASPLPEANTPQPPTQPAQPQPQPTQPPAPKPTEDHGDEDEDHKAEPTRQPEPTETHR